MKNDPIQKKPQVTGIVVLIFAIIVFLFSNCVTTQFKIHSIELERREAEYLYFRLISDIDFLDKRYEKCLIRLDYYPIDKYNPQRRVRTDGWRNKLKIYPWNESGVKEQLDVRNAGATFTVFFDHPERRRSYTSMGRGNFFFVGSKSNGMFEYQFRIDLKEENGGSWKDPNLDDELVDETYELIEGNTYVFWGRLEGPVPFAFYGFQGIRSQLYRWEVTIPK
ncbi:hypothetical protein [Leptospira alstonii]|uniref:hypothetical protein n=1 Tax=Leptospira alstonii TaxID=28452 RepID=UPI000773680B|nr:hypothetical protein [Leptospira alstonii]